MGKENIKDLKVRRIIADEEKNLDDAAVRSTGLFPAGRLGQGCVAVVADLKPLLVIAAAAVYHFFSQIMRVTLLMLFTKVRMNLTA